MLKKGSHQSSITILHNSTRGSAHRCLGEVSNSSIFASVVPSSVHVYVYIHIYVLNLHWEEQSCCFASPALGLAGGRAGSGAGRGLAAEESRAPSLLSGTFAPPLPGASSQNLGSTSCCCAFIYVLLRCNEIA